MISVLQSVTGIKHYLVDDDDDDDDDDDERKIEQNKTNVKSNNKTYIKRQID